MELLAFSCQINPFSVLVRNLRKLGITTPIRQITFGVAFTNLVCMNSLEYSFLTATSFSH